jgi:hypothetical protein
MWPLTNPGLWGKKQRILGAITKNAIAPLILRIFTRGDQRWKAETQGYPVVCSDLAAAFRRDF